MISQEPEHPGETLEAAAIGMGLLAPDRRFFYGNSTFCRMLGYSPPELTTLTLAALTAPEDIVLDEAMGQQLWQGQIAVHKIEKCCRTKTGTSLWASLTISVARDAKRRPLHYVLVMEDISERRNSEQRLKQVAWLLEPQAGKAESRWEQPPAALASKRSGGLLDSVGEEALRDIAADPLHLLDTSVAVYEKNGDYVLGLFASGWCRLLEQAARTRCGGSTIAEAIRSGGWHCHESCWEASRRSIEEGRPVDRECRGGIRIYALPIFAGGEIVGSINLGYGDPPAEPWKLAQISADYGLPVDQLTQAAKAYKSRPPFLIENAKRRLATSAKLIGAMVERKRAEQALQNSERSNRAILNSLPAHIAVLDREGAIVEVNQAWTRFGQDNGNPDPQKVAVGANYLEVCQRASQASSPEAQAALNGIQAVLNGSRAQVKLTYPCHSPDEARWFLMNVLPLAGELKGAVVTHLNITDAKRYEQALRESEERFRLLVDGVKDYAMFLLDLHGNITSWNSGAERLKGYKAEEIIGKSVSVCYIPEDVASGALQRHLAEAAQQGRSKWERWVVRKDGSRIWAEVLLTALRNEKGALRGFAEIAQDITERRRVEKELRVKEQFLSESQRIAHIGGWSWDLTGSIRWTDETYLIYGVSPKTFTPTIQSLLDLVHPDDRPAMQEWLRACAAGEKPEDLEFRTIPSDGSIRVLRGRGELILDAENKPIRMTGTVQDITERKRAEALQAGQNRVLEMLATGKGLEEVLTTLVRTVEQQCEDVTGSVLVLDEDGQHLRHGAAPGLPQQYNRLIEGLEIGPSVGSCGTAAYLGKPVIVENIEVDPLWAKYREVARQYGLRACWSQPVFSSDHRVLGTFALYPHHCRRPKAAELRLIESAAHLAGLAIERHRTEARVQAAKEGAEEANRTKDHFLAVLSHELRTPLTPVLTTVQMAEREPTLSPDLRESLSLIHRNVQLEARLIDDLLDVTRIGRGKIELQLGPVDLHSVLRHVIEVCSSDIRSKRLNLTVELNARHHHVQGDSARLQQVFWNLLKNAVKFTSTDGSIRIATEQTAEDRLAVTVKDSGVGIKPELLPCIFNVFEQGGRETTRQFGGLGLGLAISKAIVEMHGGTITASSEGKGQGAAFTVALRTSLAAEAAVPQQGLSGSGTAGLKGGRVLLVEDHPDTARTMAMLLRSYGYDVRIADSVGAALRLAQAETFDLVISDLGLPDGSGLDLMRQLSKNHPIKSIAVSGYGMEEDIRRSKEAGFSAHLTKPINLEQLEQVIGQVTA